MRYLLLSPRTPRRIARGVSVVLFTLYDMTTRAAVLCIPTAILFTVAVSAAAAR